MTNKLILGAAVVLTVFGSAISSPYAEGLGDFLNSIDGSYKGRGSVLAPGETKKQKVSCSIKNSASGTNMRISGTCATTRGKGSVSGKLSGSGSKVTGSFLAPFPGAKMLGSNGVYKNGRMAVITVFQAKNGGTTWIRQEVAKTAKGFNAKFFLRDSASGSYKPAGNLSFRKR